MPKQQHLPPPAPAEKTAPQREWDPATTRCYTPEMYRAETIVAFNLARLAAQASPGDVFGDAVRTLTGWPHSSGALQEASVAALQPHSGRCTLLSGSTACQEQGPAPEDAHGTVQGRKPMRNPGQEQVKNWIGKNEKHTGVLPLPPAALCRASRQLSVSRRAEAPSAPPQLQCCGQPPAAGAVVAGRTALAAGTCCRRLSAALRGSQRRGGAAGNPLSAGQREAIRQAADAPVMVLTGGPGCGKTFATATIVKLWRAMSGKRTRISLCAPTGALPSPLPSWPHFIQHPWMVSKERAQHFVHQGQRHCFLCSCVHKQHLVACAAPQAGVWRCRAGRRAPGDDHQAAGHHHPPPAAVRANLLQPSCPPCLSAELLARAPLQGILLHYATGVPAFKPWFS